jgi:hypothetical protein
MNRTLLASALMIAAAGSAASAQTTFRSIGILPGANSSWAYGVSADGSVVAGRSGTNFYYGGMTHGIRWTESTGLVDLDPLVNDSAAYGISGDGISLVGRGLSGSRGYRAFVWSFAGGVESIDHAFQNGALYASSSDGSVSVGEMADRNAGSHAVKYQGNRTTTIDAGSNAFSSLASGVSGDGGVIVGQMFVPSVGTRAFRWTEAGGIVNIGSPVLGGTSSAKGISSDGSTIVGDSTVAGQSHAWRWTAAGQTDLGLLELPGVSGSVANGASADGSTIVGAVTRTGAGNVAFLWRADTGMVDLNALMADVLPAGWTLTDAFATSANGQVIVGVGMNPNHEPEGFILGVPSCIAPVVRSTSTSYSVHEGEDVIFSVSATGSQVISYQWLHDGVEIAGATSRVLELFPVTGADTGKYQCRVSNACGSVLSVESGLVVNVCSGDFNDDGGVDGSDISDFFDAWENGSDLADCNHDGGVDGNDAGEFLNSWEGGC